MTEQLINELRENFATGVSGFRKIRNLPQGCPAWTFLQERDGFGVAIPNPSGAVIKEHFSSVSVESQVYVFNGKEQNLIILFCTSGKLRYEFATIAAQFVEPGPSNNNRLSIQCNPFAWWKNWRELMGNRIGEKKAYAVLGEMLAVESFLKDGQEFVWGGPSASSHDIDTQTVSVEVKSTLQKSRTEITVSSPYQLDANKPLWLYVIKFEENPKDGLTISEQAGILEQQGYDPAQLEAQLSSLGFGAGTHGRGQRYRILEKRRYLVDESFPKITPESFVGGHLPVGITHIEYTINLDGLPCENW